MAHARELGHCLSNWTIRSVSYECRKPGSAGRYCRGSASVIGGTSRPRYRLVTSVCATTYRPVVSYRVVSRRIVSCRVQLYRLRFFHETASHRLHERCCIRTTLNDNETQTALRTHCSARMTHISFASLVFRGLQRVLSADTREHKRVRTCADATSLSNRIETSADPVSFAF